MFMWFGVFGFIGNMLMARYIDRIGAPRAVMLSVTSMALTMLAWPLATSLALAAAVIVPWGLGCFAANSAQQARLVGIAPPLAPASIALNSSAIYAGQAVGAAGGGWLIAQGAIDSLHWAGLAALLVAGVVSAWATTFSHRGR
jgi:predicted MFS family arabinose efflux permease